MSYLKHKPGSIEEMMANNAKKLNDSAYQDMFKKELEKAGKGIGSMTPAEKKAFFNKIDTKYKAKNEKVDNPYAVGMAAAMKAKDDKPPLKKSTITKANDIAKSIEKDMKKEDSKMLQKDKTDNYKDKNKEQRAQFLRNAERRKESQTRIGCRSPVQTRIRRTAAVSNVIPWPRPCICPTPFQAMEPWKRSAITCIGSADQPDAPL